MIHGAFRHELVLIRDEVRASGAAIGAQLRVNCLTLCAGALLEDRHVAIAGLLDELRQVLSDADVTPEQLLAEIERLTAEVESHLDREEAELIPLLG